MGLLAYMDRISSTHSFVVAALSVGHHSLDGFSGEVDGVLGGGWVVGYRGRSVNGIHG